MGTAVMTDRDAEAGLDPAEFGRRLRAAREAAGIPSQAEAARRLGVRQSGYAKMELGDQVPGFLRLMAIVSTLGLDPKILAPEWFARKRR